MANEVSKGQKQTDRLKMESVTLTTKSVLVLKHIADRK